MAKKVDRIEKLRKLIEKKQKYDATGDIIQLGENWSEYLKLCRAIERSVYAVPKFVEKKIKAWDYDPRYPGTDFKEYLEKILKRNDLAAIARKGLTEFTDKEAALIPALREAKEKYKVWENEKLKEHRKLRNDKINEFRKDLEKEFGTENWPKRDLLWHEVYRPGINQNASYELEAVHANYSRTLLLLIKFGAF